MSTCMSHGSASRLAINGTEMGFLSFRPLSVQQLVDDASQVIDGFLDPHSGNILRGIKQVGYEVVLDPGNAEMDVLLPLIGLAEDPSLTYKSGNTVPSFSTVVDMGASVDTYTSGKVDVAILRGQKGASPVRMILRVRAADITIGAAGSFSAANPLIVPAPYAFTQGVLTIASTATQHNQFVLAIQNNLIVEHNNSITATCLEPGGRSITLSASAPYTSSTRTRLTDPWTSGTIKSSGSLAFTNGSVTSTITFGELNAIARPADRVTKMTEIRLPLTYKVTRAASNPALTWVNVNAS